MSAFKHLPASLTLLLLVGPAATFVAAQEAEPGPEAADRATPPVTVELEEAGESPRRALRYEPEVGSLQTVSISLASSITNEMDTIAMPEMKLPTTVTTITTRIDEAKDGRITANIRIDAAEVSDKEGAHPMLANQIETSIANTVGHNATLVMTDRGIGESISFNMTPNTDQMTAQMLESLESTLAMLATPLPEEPIGVGARWTSRSTIDQNGAQVSQSVTYTLTEVEGETLSLEMTVEHSAEEQTINLPEAPPNTKVELISLSLKGSGTSTMSLAHIAPEMGEIESNSRSEIMFAPPGGNAQRFKQIVESTAMVSQKED